MDELDEWVKTKWESFSITDYSEFVDLTWWYGRDRAVT
jgi:hypothetical protein